MDDERPVRVFSAEPVISYLVRGRLEEAGIPVLTKGEAEGPYRVGPVELWVPRGDEPRARALIDQIEREARDTPELGQDEDDVLG